MRSPRKTLIEKLRTRGDESSRYIDCAVKLRVHRRGKDGNAEPAELLPRAFGGVYDTYAARYVPGKRPARVHELKIHHGQVPLVSLIGKAGKRRLLGLGAPGGGKSMAIVVVAICLALWKANGVGGVVAPTRARLGIVWGKFIELAGPLGLIASISPGRKEIVLVNGTLLQFRAAAKRSEDTGSPLAGHDWQWAVEDEQQDLSDGALREVDFRGRIAADFQVFSSATNEARHEFQMRLQRYDAQPLYEVVRFSGYDNAFTPLAHWEAMKATMSSEDFDRYVNCKDVPREGRVYPTFSYSDNTAAIPARGDITPDIVAEKFRGLAVKYVVGWDPGVFMTASAIMKAYTGVGVNERNWFVLDEVTTRDATTEHHARDLAAWFRRRGVPLEHVLVLRDPAINEESDDSDDIQMKAAGFIHTKRANYGIQIERKHRIAMVNAMLRDANGRRRLLLAKSELGQPIAAKTAECLGSLMYTRNGEIDKRHGTYQDLSHWGDAVGYALYAWEQFRGTGKPPSTAPSTTVQPWRRHVGS